MVQNFEEKSVLFTVCPSCALFSCWSAEYFNFHKVKQLQIRAKASSKTVFSFDRCDPHLEVCGNLKLQLSEHLSCITICGTHIAHRPLI